MNKRGLVIAKEKIIYFNESEDHDVNLGNIIINNYKQFKDEIDIINNIPRVGVFKGCYFITCADDIVILNAFDSKLLVFLPEDIKVLNKYQRENLSSLLSSEKTDMSIESLSKDPFESNTIYTKETLIDAINFQKKRR